MPRTIEIWGKPQSVATEDELLAFANAIRQAGGAGVLEALLPSEPGDSSRCLIANALNFGCSIDRHISPTGYPYKFADDAERWAMSLPHNLTNEQRKALAGIKGVRLRKDADSGDYYLTLPKHIGNAAWAFDEGEAFQSYVKRNEP